MKRSSVVIIIIAAFLLVAGAALSFAALAEMDFNTDFFSGSVDMEKTFEFNEYFDCLSIKTFTADVIFTISDTEKTTVTCRDNKKIKYDVEVSGGFLNIKAVDTRKWYDHITFFSFGTPSVSISLPERLYFSLFLRTNTGHVSAPENLRFTTVKIDTDTGDIDWSAPILCNFSVATDTGSVKIGAMHVTDSLDVTTDTGNVDISHIMTKALKIRTDTGDVKIQNANVSESTEMNTDTGDIKLTRSVLGALKVRTSTGDVTFDGSDSSEAEIRTSTGDVEGVLLSEKIFHAESSTGNIKIPQSVKGNLFLIRTSTGDINIKISSEE